MAYIQGEGRNQGTLFPVVLDDLVLGDHMCRVVDAFVGQIDMEKLGFDRAQPAETGRSGYDPRSLLKLYLYGYLNQIRSSRRLETECRRNVEVMWLLERLYPDYRSIAEFRRIHRDAVTAAGAELVRFAKNCGLIRGEWIAIDGSKFRAVASVDTAREKLQLQRYLDSMEKLDSEESPEFNNADVQAALEKLKHHPEPEVGFMVMGRHTEPAYNLQSAVDAEHALIIAHDVVLDATDNRSLEPMAAAARAVLGKEPSMSLRTRATPTESRQPSAKTMASCRAFPLRGPGTQMATAPSSSATLSVTNPNRIRTSVQVRKR